MSVLYKIYSLGLGQFQATVYSLYTDEKYFDVLKNLDSKHPKIFISHSVHMSSVSHWISSLLEYS